jgi:tyrosyl-tRNA synthetase
MRPTGRLHLGHLVGALTHWVTLQQQAECFYFVADWHALTSDFADTSELTSYTYDNVADWIKAGAVAVGVGGSLTAGAEKNNLQLVTDTAKQFVERIAKARAK